VLFLIKCLSLTNSLDLLIKAVNSFIVLVLVLVSVVFLQSRLTQEPNDDPI
jgi:hypothetical protein